MHADLDTLCTAVYCTADDLLPEQPGNARRRVTDAEVATLCVAQAIMGIPSDRRFLAVTRKRLRDLFPELPKQPGFHKRRARLAETIEWLIGVFAAESPGYYDKREVGIELLERANRVGGEILLGDKGYAGREFAAVLDQLEATILRPARKDEPEDAIHLAPIRQRVESIFWTCKDILTLERHGARTLHNLRVRIAQRFLALAAGVALNHRLGRPSRALVDYVA
jgi:hypothetical protein